MSTSTHDNAAVRNRLDILVQILYGLAIASGLEISVPRLLESSTFSWTSLLLVVLSLIVGVLDWITVAWIGPAWRRRTTFLIDLASPLLIFLMFVAAAATPPCLLLFYAVTLLYSVLAMIYFLVHASAEPGTSGPASVSAAVWKEKSYYYVPQIAVSGLMTFALWTGRGPDLLREEASLILLVVLGTLMIAAAQRLRELKSILKAP
jgi:hypothetical protein